MKEKKYLIRELRAKDFDDLDHYFGSSSVYKKPFVLWQLYLDAQENGSRVLAVLEYNGKAVGFATLKYISEYPYFKAHHIPEINDLLVAPAFRNKGYGRALIKFLEDVARKKNYKLIGLAVGLYSDYGAAQRLYAKMGYIPDGNGITCQNDPVIPGESYRVDDDLVLWLTKAL